MNAKQKGPRFRAPCRNLRSKEMYHEAGGEGDEQFASGIYWCAQTQENFGPDGQAADKTGCCTGRQCYLG